MAAGFPDLDLSSPFFLSFFIPFFLSFFWDFPDLSAHFPICPSPKGPKIDKVVQHFCSLQRFWGPKRPNILTQLNSNEPRKRSLMNQGTAVSSHFFWVISIDPPVD